MSKPDEDPGVARPRGRPWATVPGAPSNKPTGLRAEALLTDWLARDAERRAAREARKLARRQPDPAPGHEA